MKNAVIWDLDGTMWDSSLQVSLAWNEYMRMNGIDRRFTRDDCRGYCGKTLEQIAAVVFPDAAPAWRNRVIIACCDAECIPLAEHGGELFDGLLPTLATLHQHYAQFVVSNCGLGYIEAFFSGNHTAEYFDDYENAARTGKGKAENIRLIMERNAIDRAVYIGDTRGDWLSARQAGVEFVHASYGYGSVPEAEHFIQRLDQLPALVHALLPDTQD